METALGVAPASQTRTRGYVMPRPSNPVMKALLKGPILMWRLGLGPLLGRSIMILTTTGRKSGLPRHTAVGFSRQDGRRYVLTLRGPKTDWYSNLVADPHVTVQTADSGAKGNQMGLYRSEHAIGRRVTGDMELAGAYDFLAPMPVMQTWAAALGTALTPEALVAHKDDFILVAFDAAEDDSGEALTAYPSPVKTDLWWVWLVVHVAALAVWLAARAARRHKRHAAPLAG